MYNFTIMRLSCWGTFRSFFCAGICLGGLGGIILGILDRTMIGIFGGIFFGLVFGLCSGFFGAFYAAVFNLLSPVIGGLAVYLEPADQGQDGEQPLIALAEETDNAVQSPKE